MAHKTLTITIKADNTLKVSEDPCKVRKNDTLNFVCGAGELAILFAHDRSPYANGRKAHAAHQGEATAKLKIRGLSMSEKKAKTNPRLQGARFKYGVAVMKPATGQVLVLDPDIIIDDPGA
jgi:hypothetical protein